MAAINPFAVALAASFRASQHATPRERSAAPATRLTVTPTDVPGGAPSSNSTSIEGATSKTSPVAASNAPMTESSNFLSEPAVARISAPLDPQIRNGVRAVTARCYGFVSSIGSGSGRCVGPNSALDCATAVALGSSLNVSLLILPVNLNGGS